MGFGDGDGVGGELLAEAHGDGILQVGTAGLHDVVELMAFGGEGGGEPIQDRVEIFEREQSAEAHGGGEDVVGGLAVVNVIVGVDEFVGAEGSAENLIGAVGDDLVRVHVEADAGAGLEDVDGELVVVVAVHLMDFGGGLDDGVGDWAAVRRSRERLAPAAAILIVAMARMSVRMGASCR